MIFRSIINFKGSSVPLLIKYLWLIPLISNLFSIQFQTADYNVADYNIDKPSKHYTT